MIGQSAGDVAAIAWDMDGTLVDSEPSHWTALVRASEALGAQLDGMPEAGFPGQTMVNVWEEMRAQMPPDIIFDDWLQAVHAYYVRHAETIVPWPHARDVVRALRAAGIRQAVVSNGSRDVLEANLEVLGQREIMEFTLSADDMKVGKPDPAPYLQACERFGLAPDRVVAVEDSLAGVRAARAAGLRCLVYGAGPVEPVLLADPNVTRIRDLREVLTCFGIAA